MFQESQNLSTALSSCLSGRVNRAQQARFSALTAAYLPRGNSPYATATTPVLLNSSALASAVDPQTLFSCFFGGGGQDTVQHVGVSAGLERETQPELSFTLYVRKGSVYLDSDCKHCIYRESKCNRTSRKDAWRDPILRVGRPLSAGSRRRMTAVEYWGAIDCLPSTLNAPLFAWLPAR